MGCSLLRSVITSVITPTIKNKASCFISLSHYPPLMRASYHRSRARSILSCCNSHADDDMNALFQILPCDLRDTLLCDPSQDQLVEVILDLGCLPQALHR